MLVNKLHALQASEISTHQFLESINEFTIIINSTKLTANLVLEIFGTKDEIAKMPTLLNNAVIKLSANHKGVVCAVVTHFFNRLEDRSDKRIYSEDVSTSELKPIKSSFKFRKNYIIKNHIQILNSKIVWVSRESRDRIKYFSTYNDKTQILDETLLPEKIEHSLSLKGHKIIKLSMIANSIEDQQIVASLLPLCTRIQTLFIGSNIISFGSLLASLTFDHLTELDFTLDDTDTVFFKAPFISRLQRLKIHIIDFMNRENAIAELAQAQLPELTYLKLVYSPSRYNRIVDLMLARRMPKLEELELYLSHPYRSLNDLPEFGLNQVVSPIKRFSLFQNSSSMGSDVLVNALPKLKNFRFSCDHSIGETNNCLEALSLIDNSSIRDLSMEGKNAWLSILSPFDLARFFSAPLINPLESLNLSHTHLSIDKLQTLEGFAGSLQRLFLRNNGLDNTSIKALQKFDFIKNLIELDLSNEQLENISIKEKNNYFKNNEYLVNIEFPKLLILNLGATSLTNFRFQANLLPNLEVLNLSDNNISDNDLAKLRNEFPTTKIIL